MGMPSDIPTPTSRNMMDGHRPNPIRHGENLFATFKADAPQHHKPDNNMRSHINEETLQLAAMGPNILMASISQAQLASMKLQVATKITKFDGK